MSDIAAELEKAVMEASAQTQQTPETPAPPPATVAQTQTQPETPPPAPQPPVEVKSKSLEEVAKERAEARRQQEIQSALKEYTPEQLANAVAILKGQQPQQTQQAPQNQSDVEVLRGELAQLKAFQAQVTREKTLAGIRETVSKDERFSHVKGLDAFDKVEGVLVEYYNKYGELPGSTFAESVAVAADIVEGRLKAEAEKWKKVLTSQNTVNSVPTKAPEPPSVPKETPGQVTLTNQATSSPASTSKPKSNFELL